GPLRSLDGEEVRRPGLPTRGWRGLVRVRPAPLDLRLHQRERVSGEPYPGVRGPPPRTLRRSYNRQERALHAAKDAGLQHRDEAGVARRVRVPYRRCLGAREGNSRLVRDPMAGKPVRAERGDQAGYLAVEDLPC